MLTNTKKINILLYGNVPSRDFRSQTLIKLLQNSGHHISLVCPDRYIPKSLKKYSVFKKIFAQLHLIDFIIKASSTDAIYLLPMNVNFIKSAVVAAKFFNKKLIVEMYMSLYDTLVRDRKLVKDGSRKAKALLEKDKLALTQSDSIIHTSSHELTYWLKILGIKIDQKKVFIAPLCNTSTLVSKRSFMQDGILNICWWGTFIPLHGIDNILQAMKILKDKQVQFTCNLFGVSNEFFPIYADKIQLERINTHVFLRKDLNFSDGSLPNYIVDNCDLALGVFGNTDKARNGIQNKLIEALSMGIPTLTMNSLALREFFNPETDLWTCEPTPESIAETILTIAEGAAHPVDWEQTRQKVLDTFSVVHYQEVVSKVLQKVTDDLLGVDADVESGVFATPKGCTKSS